MDNGQREYTTIGRLSIATLGRLHQICHNVFWASHVSSPAVAVGTAVLFDISTELARAFSSNSSTVPIGDPVRMFVRIRDKHVQLTVGLVVSAEGGPPINQQGRI